MGLDSVELVMAAEDEFQIHLPDEEVNSIYTVGAFYDVILAKLNIQEQKQACLTSVAFYRMRRALCEVIDRKKVKPTTILSSLFPLKKRRANWKRLQEKTNLYVPGLDIHRQTITLFTAGSYIGTSIIATSAGWIPLDGALFPQLFWAVVMIPVVWSLSFLFLNKSTPFLKLDFPDDTVGGLAMLVAGANAQLLSEEVGGADRQKIWERVRYIVVSRLGVKPEQVTPEARFIEDLNMN